MLNSAAKHRNNLISSESFNPGCLSKGNYLKDLKVHCYIGAKSSELLFCLYSGLIKPENILHSRSWIKQRKAAMYLQ